MYRDNLPAPLIVTAFNGNVIALEAATGSIAWKKELPVVRVLIDERTVYVARSDAQLAALDYLTGQERWTVHCKVDGSLRVTMLETAEAIYVSFGGELACVSKAGVLLWRNPLPGTGYGSAAIGIPGAVAQNDDRG